jgi:hypothetical protein
MDEFPAYQYALLRFTDPHRIPYKAEFRNQFFACAELLRQAPFRDSQQMVFPFSVQVVGAYETTHRPYMQVIRVSLVACGSVFRFRIHGLSRTRNVDRIPNQ